MTGVPSKPWCVTQKTSRGNLPSTKFRSEKAAYEAVVSGRVKAEQGITNFVGCTVEHWEDGRWRLYERIDYPQHPDQLAIRYEEAAKDYRERPDMPRAYEDMQSAWDAMVEKVEELLHDVDTCKCRSCVLYRAGTKE